MRIGIYVSLLVWICIPNASPARPPADEHIRDLRSSAAAVRQRAAISLGQMGDDSGVPALIEALKDSEAGVRREAAKALGFIKDSRATPSLLNTLADNDANVRLYAAYALGEIKDARASDALLQALHDPEWCVRDQAAWALREINDPKITEPLIRSLNAKKADVPHIVWLLQQMPDTQTTARLSALLEDPKAETRKRAIHALAKIGGSNVVDSLIVALDNSDPSIRRYAVQTLGRLGDSRVKDPLKGLAARERDASVRQAVDDALFQMSPRKHLVAWWSFDDQNASIAKDVTGRGNDGEMLGCTPVDGRIGSALRFSDGKYIEFGQPAGLPIGGKPLTVMAWAKSDADNGVVIARGGAYCGFSLYVKDGVAKFGIHRSQEEPAYIAAGTDDVVGSWVHLAGVINEDRIELYVNGKLAATAKTPGYIPGNCGQGLEIGYDVSNSPAEIIDNFEGVIDEVRIYQAALNEDEIREITNNERDSNEE